MEFCAATGRGDPLNGQAKRPHASKRKCTKVTKWLWMGAIAKGSIQQHLAGVNEAGATSWLIGLHDISWGSQNFGVCYRYRKGLLTPD